MGKEISRRDFIKFASAGIVAGTMALTGCNKVINTVTTETPTPISSPTNQAPTATDELATPVATEQVPEKKPLVDQLVFEREIPQLTQAEMAKIVEGAYRFKNESGQIYSLGYIPQSMGYIGMEAIFIDLEISKNKIDGDEFWRMLLITEVKRAGGFEKNDEKKYLVVPVYVDSDEAQKYRIGLTNTPSGVPSTEGGSFVKMDTAYTALNEQKEKHGNFQIFITTIAVDKDYLEMLKKTNNWEIYQNRATRNFENSENINKFEEYLIKNDFEGAKNFLENNKSMLFLNDISISSD